MKIQSMQVDFSTLTMEVRFESATDMRTVADRILNDGNVTNEEMDRQIKLLCRGNQFIEAIRYHRGITNLSLKESKDYCEKIRDGVRDGVS